MPKRNLPENLIYGHPVQELADKRMKAILDIRGLLIHAWKATKDRDSRLKTEDGKPIAGYKAGFNSFLSFYIEPLLKQQGFAPIDLIAVWDGGNKFRKSLFPEYKAHRAEKDPTESAEFEKLEALVKEFLAAIGAVQVRVAGVEADDVIALFCQNLHHNIALFTVDKDLLQLVSDNVDVFLKGEYVDPEDAFNGIPLSLITVYKALVGDTSDGYKGVPGFGDKAFRSLLAEYGEDGMLELEEMIVAGEWNELLAIASEDNNKTLLKIVENKQDASLCYKLAKLHPNLCEGYVGKRKVKIDWYKRVPTEDRLKYVLEKHELMYLFNDYVDYTTIMHLVSPGDDLDDLLEGHEVNPIAFDFESYDPVQQQSLREAAREENFVDVLRQIVTGASLCYGDNFQCSIYIPVKHRGQNVDTEVLVDVLRKFKDRLIVHNDAFEKVVSDLNFGEDVELDNLCDIRIMASHVDENTPNHLKSLSKQWLNYTQQTYLETLQAAGAENMAELTGEQVLKYGCDDSIVTAHLWVVFDLILQLEGTRDFVYSHEFNFDLVQEAFKEGVPIDWELLDTLRKEDEEKRSQLVSELHQLVSEVCSEPNMKAVEIFMGEIYEFERASCKEKWKSTASKSGVSSWRKQYGFDEDKTERTFNEAFEIYWQEKKSELIEASYYKKYEKQTSSKSEFVPTITRLNKLLKTCGFEDNQLLKSVAVSKITEWAASIAEQALSEEQKTIAGAICSAAHSFKRREGDEYERLKALYDEKMGAKVIETEAGDKLDVESSADMTALLYLKLGLPVRIRGKVTFGSFRDEHGLPGSPSTSDKALETAIAEDTEEGSKERRILQLVRDIRKINTKFKMYYNPYPLWKYDHTGRIHPQIKNCGTVTRRPTGNSPNILQVAKGPIRKIYRPLRKGHIFVDPDFSGQELRILASECEDETMLDAYLGEVKKDIHSLTASAIAPKIIKRQWPHLYNELEFDAVGMSYDQFETWRASEDPEYSDPMNWIRNKRAKGVNFLVNYEGKAGTLAQNLLIPFEEAEDYINLLFERYPGIKKWQEMVHKIAREQGYVETAYGNRRHLGVELVSGADYEKFRWQRQATNFIIQSTAADILKVVIADIKRKKLNRAYDAVTVAPVYDELLNSVPVEAALDYMLELKHIMEVTPPGHKVPMVAEFEIGDSWGNLVEVKELTTDCYEEALDKLNFLTKQSEG